MGVERHRDPILSTRRRRPSRGSSSRTSPRVQRARGRHIRRQYGARTRAGDRVTDAQGTSTSGRAVWPIRRSSASACFFRTTCTSASRSRRSAGKHVVCEKPLGQTVGECGRMLAGRRREAGRTMLSGPQPRLRPRGRADGRDRRGGRSARSSWRRRPASRGRGTVGVRPWLAHRSAVAAVS